MVIETKKIKSIEELEKQERIVTTFRNVILYILIIAGCFAVIVPFYFMIVGSMQTNSEIRAMSLVPNDLLPFKWLAENYLNAINRANFGLLFTNTFIVGFGTVGANLITSTLAAYSLARKRFVGRETIFLLLLSTMMIPGEMMTITNFATVMRSPSSGGLGWGNTFQAMIVPFAANVSYIFFLRQAIRQIPDQLYQAAKVDGVSDFKFLFRIVLPIVKPTIITILILGITGAFNAYIWPNLVASNENMRLISTGLRNAFTEADMNQDQLSMAASAIVTIPLLVIFISLRKYIIKGVSRSGIKG